jgi:hypothetical protein
MRRKGRDFEEMVARIEGGLAPFGANVKSPDYIPDKVTGTDKEVDVSIRYRIGTAEVLVVIECRDRSEMEESTWIEQIATKSRDIGAAVTIAVSSSGFTEPAIKKANGHNILLRTTQDVEAKDVAQWLSVEEASFRYNLRELIKLQVQLYESSEGTAVVDEVQARFARDAADAGLFVQIADGRTVTVNELFFKALQQNPDFWSRIPTDGIPIEAEFRIEVPRNTLAIGTTAGTREVELVAMKWKVKSTIDRAPFRRVAYSDEHGTLAQSCEATTAGHVVSLCNHFEAGVISVDAQPHSTDEKAHDGAQQGVRWTPASITVDLQFFDLPPGSQPEAHT